MRTMQEDFYKVTDLDLILDHTLHQMRRGSLQPVDFGGNCRRWAVLTELAKCYPKYCSKTKLIDAVWAESDPAFQGIEDGTIHSTVSAVRTALRSVGITITYKKDLGYRLQEIRR